MLKQPTFWVYILRCSNNSLYTGYTIDLNQRYSAHRDGLAAKYTRSFPPTYIAAVWPILGTKAMAMQVERFIKRLDKKAKQDLIDNPLSLEELFSEN